MTTIPGFMSCTGMVRLMSIEPGSNVGRILPVRTGSTLRCRKNKSPAAVTSTAETAIVIAVVSTWPVLEVARATR